MLIIFKIKLKRFKKFDLSLLKYYSWYTNTTEQTKQNKTKTCPNQNTLTFQILNMMVHANSYGGKFAKVQYNGRWLWFKHLRCSHHGMSIYEEKDRDGNPGKLFTWPFIFRISPDEESSDALC